MDWDSVDPGLMLQLLDCRKRAAALRGPIAAEEILAKVGISKVARWQNLIPSFLPPQSNLSFWYRDLCHFSSGGASLFINHTSQSIGYSDIYQ